MTFWTASWLFLWSTTDVRYPLNRSMPKAFPWNSGRGVLQRFLLKDTIRQTYRKYLLGLHLFGKVLIIDQHKLKRGTQKIINLSG